MGDKTLFGLDQERSRCWRTFSYVFSPFASNSHFHILLGANPSIAQVGDKRKSIKVERNDKAPKKARITTKKEPSPPPPPACAETTSASDDKVVILDEIIILDDPDSSDEWYVPEVKVAMAKGKGKGKNTGTMDMNKVRIVLTVIFCQLTALTSISGF